MQSGSGLMDELALARESLIAWSVGLMQQAGAGAGATGSSGADACHTCGPPLSLLSTLLPAMAAKDHCNLQRTWTEAICCMSSDHPVFNIHPAQLYMHQNVC